MHDPTYCYCFPIVVELFFFQIVIFCFHPPSMLFWSKYDVPPFFVICYDSSFETSAVNPFYDERVVKALLHVHIREIIVDKEFITLFKHSFFWLSALVQSLLPIFIVLSSFIDWCDVSCGWSSLFLPSLGGWPWLSSRAFLLRGWCSIARLFVGLLTYSGGHGLMISLPPDCLLLSSNSGLRPV